MAQKVLARGAEAVISKSGNKVVKDRIPKGYRHPDLDKKLRKRRTKAEIKLLTKANKIIPTPRVLDDDNYEITLEYIDGKKLSDHLEKTNYTKVCRLIGSNIAKLHDSGLIHGDLTTSNMILTSPRSGVDGGVFFIDFGLGFHSDKIEDKATDLHLIKQALEARHSKIFEKAFKSVLEGYKISKNYKSVLERLTKVEKRGRYKTQY
jgi:Kae1-associated kinase Bud32